LVKIGFIRKEKHMLMSALNRRDEEMMSNHIFYIDKTDFIREWWEFADKVTLITRPRRFTLFHDDVRRIV